MSNKAPVVSVIVFTAEDYPGVFHLYGGENETTETTFAHDTNYSEAALLITLGTCLSSALSAFQQVGTMPPCWDGFTELLDNQLKTADLQLGSELDK